MGALSDLKKNRKAMFEKISKEIDKQESGGDRKQDDRFWRPTQDKDGNGSAIIRFLPPLNGDEMPWVRMYNYAFQAPNGKWYIENSRQTIGEPDPVQEYVGELWAQAKETGSKEIEMKAKSMGRKTRYISNIVVLKDPGNPENEGKVFLFGYGKKIHDMIVAKAKPEFDDEKPCYVYDPWEGANFRLRIKKVDKYPNYDSSAFDSPSELFEGDDERLEEIFGQAHKLSELVDPSQFKSYDDLKKRFEGVINASSVRPAAADVDDENKPSNSSKGKKSNSLMEDDEDGDNPFKDQPEKEAKKPSDVKTEKVSTPSLDDDDDLAEFKSLLDEI